jgi:NAD(P)H-hydrate epimerase
MTTPRKPPTRTDEIPQLSRRPANMHKGQAGRVAIVAGSRGMSGAAILAGLGALRGGAGLVRVVTPESVQPIVAAAEPCLMTLPCPEKPGWRVEPERFPMPEVQEWADVLAVGPGIGQTTEACALVWQLLEHTRVPLVLDADGLNVLAQPTLWPPGRQERWWTLLQGRSAVLTPHPGEMARLRAAAGLPETHSANDQARLSVAHELACLTGLTVVLKGHRTVVCTATESYINTTGNPGMATGGMGDVLTGLIAALLAQGLSAFDAARLAVYAHGLAADYCEREIAPVGYLAREVAEAVPRALAEASRPRIGFK